MKKISKKILATVVFVSIVTTFILTANNIFASEFEGNESEWTALCSTYLTDPGTIQKCNEYRAYLSNLKNQNANQAAEAQGKIDSMQGNVDSLAELSKQYAENVASINSEVDSINSAIAQSDEALGTLDVQISEKTSAIESQTEVVLERMVDMQGLINTNAYINMIMGSEDLLSFINKVKGIAVFTELDKEMIEELNNSVAALEVDKNEQTRIKEIQEVQRGALVVKQAEAEEVKAANDAVYAALQTEISNLQSVVDISSAAAEEIAALTPSVALPPVVDNGGNGGDGGGTGGGYNPKEANFYSGWYDSSRNVFSPVYTGQCTWYVWGRANEVNGGGVTNLPTGNAQQWYYQAAGRFAVGSTPRTNSIIVLGGGPYGHVAYIESYDEATGMMRVSEGNVNAPGGGLPIYTPLETAIAYTVDYTWTVQQYLSSRAPLGLIGYIYL